MRVQVHHWCLGGNCDTAAQDLQLSVDKAAGQKG